MIFILNFQFLRISKYHYVIIELMENFKKMIGSKNILVLAIFLLLLILLNFFIASCSLLPAPTKGIIKGRVLLPEEVNISSRDISGWVPVACFEITIIDTKGVAHVKTTDENGYYSFENIAVKANTVVTANTKINDKFVILKNIIPIAVDKDKNYNVGTMTPESTALALIIERLLLDKETDIYLDLDKIRSTISFDELVEQIEKILKEPGNVTNHPVVDDLIKNVVEEFFYEAEQGQEEESVPPVIPARLTVKTVNITSEPTDVSGLDNGKDVIITLSTPTIGANIYYTLNGRNPTSDSIKYTAPFVISTIRPEGETITVNAIGIKTGYTDSAVSTKYIVFKIKTVAITFNSNGGSPVPTITQDYGTPFTMPDNPTKEGYIFAGWNLPVPAIMPAENITLTARWTISTYTVTFQDHDGTELKVETVEHGKAATAPEHPSREGYTSTGWDMAFDNITSQMTVTARYTANQYTVTFDALEGTVPITSIGVTFDSFYGTLPIPTRAGHGFAGWYTEASNGTEVTSSTSVTDANNHILYARWTDMILNIEVYSEQNHQITITSNYGDVVKGSTRAEIVESGFDTYWINLGNNLQAKVTTIFPEGMTCLTLTPDASNDRVTISGYRKKEYPVSSTNNTITIEIRDSKYTSVTKSFTVAVSNASEDTILTIGIITVLP